MILRRLWARVRMAWVLTSTFHRCPQYLGEKQSMFDKNTVGISCTRRISGLYCRYCEYLQYFGVLYYLLRILPCSNMSGFATVDAPCASSISGFCPAGTMGAASNGSISSVGVHSQYQNAPTMPSMKNTSTICVWC